MAPGLFALIYRLGFNHVGFGDTPSPLRKSVCKIRDRLMCILLTGMTFNYSPIPSMYLYHYGTLLSTRDNLLDLIRLIPCSMLSNR